MSKLNPFYILALLSTFVLISFLNLKEKEEKLLKINSEYSAFKVEASDYKISKKSILNEKRVIQKIDSILKSSKYKNENIVKKKEEKFITLRYTSNNKNLLNSFLNSVLNSSFIIDKVKIKEDSIFIQIGLKR